MAGYNILLVDDEQDALSFLDYNLQKEGYTVYKANSGKKAIEIALEVKPHLILLDIMMPDMDGIETCERLRSIPEMNPVLICFLSARSEDYSQIAAFEAGADGYLTKPIRPKVLVSYIRALFKRNHTPSFSMTAIPLQTSVSVGPLTIDGEKYIVLKEGQEIYLPRKEFNLLCLLTSKPSKVFTRQEIYFYLWGPDVQVGERTIDVYIRKLREKIGDQYIRTIKGLGYKFNG